MPKYRLTTETGDVVETASHEHDQAAVIWRSAHPFESASHNDDSRQLRLERQEDDDRWIRIPAPLGTSEAT